MDRAPRTYDGRQIHAMRDSYDFAESKSQFLIMTRSGSRESFMTLAHSTLHSLLSLNSSQPAFEREAVILHAGMPNMADALAFAFNCAISQLRRHGKVPDNTTPLDCFSNAHGQIILEGPAHMMKQLHIHPSETGHETTVYGQLKELLTQIISYPTMAAELMADPRGMSAEHKR